MRKGLLTAAFAALICMGSLASADTVQTSTTTMGCTEVCTKESSALQPFDPSLGNLTGITLDVTGSEEVDFIASPIDPSSPSSIDASYSGPMTVTVNGVNYLFGISGNANIPLSLNIFHIFTASGSGSFQIDPSLFSTFIGTSDACSPLPPFPTGICVTAGKGNSFLGTYTPNNATSPRPDGSEADATYTLTYIYTPFGEAVPEPASWATTAVPFRKIWSPNGLAAACALSSKSAAEMIR